MQAFLFLILSFLLKLETLSWQRALSELSSPWTVNINTSNTVALLPRAFVKRELSELDYDSPAQSFITTMRSSLPLLAVLAATAAAKTVVINVGQSGFSFSPDSSTADVGDVLEFHFFGSIHTAVQSDFSSPCAMSSSGFDSGPINNKADGSVSIPNIPPTSTRWQRNKYQKLTI